jgi:membrane protease YdiL (CAAX protease family)
MTIEPWLRRHPLLAYCAAVYGISWGGVLVVVGAHGFDLVHLRPADTGLIFVAMLLGPSVGGLAMTAVLDGRAGLRRLKVSLMRWRVGVRWYAVAVLTMPLVLLTVLWPLSAVVDAAFAPRFQWPLFAIGLIAGSFEEIGWTGFATPRLLALKRLFIAGLSLGLVWALWHGLVDFRQNFNTLGAAWLLQFAAFYVAALTAYRLLMTWLYANTQSLLLAVLMHASYTGWLFVLYPATSFEQGLVWQTAFAVGLWVVVAVVVAGSAHRASRLAAQRPVKAEASRVPR